MSKPFTFLIFFMVILVVAVILLGHPSKADFNCTSTSKASVNGTWYANFSGCSLEPRENITVILNVTNITQKDTLLDEAVSNITSSFNQAKRIEELNGTLQLCIKDSERLSPIEQEFQRVKENATTCNTNLNLMSGQLSAASNLAAQKGQEAYYYLGGGLLAGFVVASWRRIFRREPSDRTYRVATGETHESGPFQKESRERSLELKIEELEKRLEDSLSHLMRKKKGR